MITATAGRTPAPVWPGLTLALLGSIAFSAKAIIVKLAYRYGVDAVTLIMYRMLFALPLFVLLAWWAGRGKPPLARRDWITRLILYLNPTLVLALGALLFGRKVSVRQVLALALSYCGVLLVFGHEASLQGTQALLGTALVFASALSYAVYLVYSGEEVGRLGALRLTGLATSVACVLCIAQFFILRPLGAFVVAPEVVWLSLLNATLCTFAPVLMVMMAIERIGAVVAAQTGMVGPMSTILMSVAILDEPFTVWLALGTVLVLSGIWLLAKWR